MIRLSEGDNYCELSVPKGKYMLQFRELKRNGRPTANFRIVGEVACGERLIHVAEAYVPTPARDGVALPIEVADRASKVVVDVRLDVLDHSHEAVFLVFGPRK